MLKNTERNYRRRSIESNEVISLVKELKLPNAKVGQIKDLLEKLSLLGGSSDKDGLAYALGIKKGSIYNPLKAAEILGFVSVDKDQIKITEIGSKFVASNEDGRKSIFREQAIKIEPFTTISKALRQAKEIDDALVLRLAKAKIKAARKWKRSSEKEMLKMIINWGEYSGLFKHDKSKRKICLGT